MQKPQGWLSEKQLAAQLGLSNLREATEIIRHGVASGLFDGQVRKVGGRLYFRPDTAAFVRWTSRLGDAVLAGHLSLIEADRLIRRRAWRRTYAALA